MEALIENLLNLIIFFPALPMVLTFVIVENQISQNQVPTMDTIQATMSLASRGNDGYYDEVSLELLLWSILMEECTKVDSCLCDHLDHLSPICGRDG